MQDDSEFETEPETSFGPNVAAAMDGVVELDERGLMPLQLARTVVESAHEFDGEHGDRLWAALLSLEDGAQASAVAMRWRWSHMPRGRDNVAPVERYGAEILPWLRSRVVDGVLINAPWCIVPCLLELAGVEVLELLWALRGVRDRVQMQAWTVIDDGEAPGDPDEEASAAADLLDHWIAEHAEVALPWLVARADTDMRALGLLAQRAALGGATFLRTLAESVGEPRAVELFERHAWPRTLTAAQILAELDRATGERWPEFNYAFDGRQEYFALRLIAVREREGEGWGVVFERLSGSYPQNSFVARFAFGSALTSGSSYDDIVHVEIDTEGPADEHAHLFHGGVVRGPAGELVLDEGIIDRADLRPGKCTEIGYHPMRALAIRAWLSAYTPASLWPPVADAVACLGLDDAETIVISEAFAHVIGPYQREGVPEGDWQIAASESPTFCSLAQALLERDAERFEPGEPNTDWRMHVYVDHDITLPWHCARFQATALGERGHLRAAMLEAGVALDDRGLMSLAEARELIERARVFEKGEGRAIGELWVQDSDRLWAAMLSLADGDELARAGTRLRWAEPPRGGDTLAPLERYGDELLAWLHACVHERVLVLEPACLRANALGLASPAMIDLLLELEGVSGAGEGTPALQRSELIEAYFAAHRDLAIARLSSRSGEVPRARELLRAWALLDEQVDAALSEATRSAIALPRGLTAEHVLAQLDRQAGRPVHEIDAWPRFVHGTDPRDEYHALRLLAARTADGRWAVVLERLSGGRNPTLRRYVHGRGVGPVGRREDLELELELELDDDGVHGPAGLLAADAIDPGAGRLCEPPDYWTERDGIPGQVSGLRSYLARFPDAFAPPAAELLAALGLADAELLIDSRSFSHAGPDELAPSQSPSWRSIADVVASGDASRFEPGESDLEWSLHVQAQVETSGC